MEGGGGKSGTLNGAGKDYTVTPFTDTGSASQGVSAHLQEMNSVPLPPEAELPFQAVPMAQQQAETEQELARLMQELGIPKQEKPTEAKPAPKANAPMNGKSTKAESSEARAMPQRAETRRAPEKSSIFTLARDVARQSPQAARAAAPQLLRGKEAERTRDNNSRIATPFASKGESQEGRLQERLMHESKHERERDREGSGGGGQQREREEEKEKKRGKYKIGKVSCSQGSKASAGGQQAHEPGGADSIFIRFMALMARILGQAEAEAHELYLKIKHRTDDIDTLTQLTSKINSQQGAIDWSNSDEMKKLVDKAREIGVDIPAGKYKWTEDEKKLLKENIQMRKDSMEKITQLERTDMQRYLQEASQCHQARSNILKLLKEVTDTIIHNMRPN